MVRLATTRNAILEALSDGRPKSHQDILQATGLGKAAVWNGLSRCWHQGYVLRTRHPLYTVEKVFRGRGGMHSNTRPFHLYVRKAGKEKGLMMDGMEFVGYREEFKDARGGGGTSKAQRVLTFLKEKRDRAWFSIEIAAALKAFGVRVSDIMANVRRFERKGWV